MLLDVIDEFLYRHLQVQNRSSETVYGYRKDLYRFNDWLVDRYQVVPEVSMLTRQLIESYLRYLQTERGYAEASQQRMLVAIKSFLRYAHREGVLEANPAGELGSVSVPEKEKVALSEEEIGRLLEDNRGTVVGSIMGMLYNSGMRIGELCSLQEGDLDFVTNILHVRRGKGNKYRRVPMNEKLRAAIVDYRENLRPPTESPYLLATERTGRISANYAWRMVKRALREAGISKEITSHSFRHAFAQSLLRRKTDIYHISALLGHKSVRTTQVYLYAEEEELRGAVDKL